MESQIQRETEKWRKKREQKCVGEKKRERKRGREGPLEECMRITFHLSPVSYRVYWTSRFLLPPLP